jgi:hypothetical protein
VIQAIEGFLLGIVTGGLSVYSLWLITGFTAKVAAEIEPTEPTRWHKRFAFFKWDSEDDIEEEESPSESTQNIKPKTQNEQATSAPVATVRVFAAFLLKAPLLIAVAYVAQLMGDVALHWCVGGVVLVYFVAVFWAAARTNRQ